MINLVNSKVLNNMGLVLEIESVQGNILSNIEFDTIELMTKKRFSILQAKRLTLSYRLSTLFNPNPEIRGIELEGGVFSFPSSVDTLNALFAGKKGKSENHQISSSSPQIQKELKTWAFDFGVIDFTFNYENHAVKIPNLFGNFSMIKNDIAIAIDTACVMLDDRFECFNLSQIKIKNSNTGFGIENLHILNYDMELLAQFDFPKDSTKIIEFSISNINPNNYLPDQKEQFSPEDHLNLSGKFEIDYEQHLDLAFNGILRGNPIDNGKLVLNLHDKLFDVPEFSFNSQEEKIKANFFSKSSKQHKGKIAIDNINLVKWNVVTTNTCLTGNSDFNIVGELAKPQKVIAQINFKDTGIDTLNINGLTGKVEYADDKLTIIDDIICRIDSTFLEVRGNSDLADKQLGFDCKVYSPDISIFSPLANNQQIEGKISGNFSVSGDFANPDIRGNISADSIGVPEIKFAEAQLKFGLLNVAKNRFGSLVLHAKSGETKFVDAPIPILNLDITFKDDTTNVRLLNVKGDIFNVSAKGKIVTFSDIFVDSLDMVLKSNHFYNVSPINVTLNNKDVHIKQSHLKINDSDFKFRGEVVDAKLSYADAELTDFNLAAINDFLPKKHFVDGIFTGNFAYNTSVDSQKINLKIDGKDLVYRKDHFNRFAGELSLVNDKIIIPEIVLSDSTNGSLQAKGNFTCNFPMLANESFVDTTNEVDLRMDFSNFDLSILNTYILYNTRIDGKLIGDVSFKNSINHPDIETNIYVLQPVYDKIELKTIRLNAKTEGNDLNISNIYFTDEAGSYYGEGRLPLDVALLDGIFTLDFNRQMEADFYSEINSIPALPKYVEEIQSFNGNMLLTMRLRGTPSAATGNGKINITNGELRLTDLENPIFDLNGTVDIENNVINISQMTGKLKKERYSNFKTNFANLMEKIFPKKIIDPNKPNVDITGMIDLSEITKPVIDLKMVAKDAYIRTPLGEQEGIADLKMNITGKDSLFVDGDILLKNFTVRNELVATGETFQEPNPNAMHTELNMKVTSPGNFFISNSQLDCELEGEAWLMKSGNEDIRISGDFDVIDGSLYFYQWNFKDLSGNIMFKPDELNPTLDLQASVDLSGFTDNGQTGTTAQTEGEENLVTIYLTGDLEKPDIQFESSSGQYDQSSILRILTGTDDESLSDMQSNARDMGIGMFSGYIERQLERSLSNITGMSEFQVKNGSSDLMNMNLNEMSFTMGRRITTNIYMTFDRDYDKLNADATNSVGLRWRIDKKKSISGQISNNGLFEVKYRFRQHY